MSPTPSAAALASPSARCRAFCLSVLLANRAVPVCAIPKTSTCASSTTTMSNCHPTPQARSSFAHANPTSCSMATGSVRKTRSKSCVTCGSTPAISASSTRMTSSISSIARKTTCVVAARTFLASKWKVHSCSTKRSTRWLLTPCSRTWARTS
ncbi:hypothetical protein D9M71_657320 [compost metagenome]